jgi:U3 small nucleolar RNA-associated protein 14
VSEVIDLSFSDDDLSIEHEKSKKKVVKNEDEKVAGKDDFDSINSSNVTSI